MPTMDEEKASIIAQALMTEDGRTALAHAMVIPISDSLELFGMNEVMQKPTREIAHHNNIDGRYDTNNGATMCQKHHIEFHKVYGKKNTTIEQYREFMK